MTVPDYISLGVALVALSVSVFALRKSQKARAVSFMQSLKGGWNSLNTTALSSSENLEAASSLHNYIRSVESPESQRKCWLAFFYFNAIHITWLSARNGYMEQKDLDTTAQQHLRSVLDDPVVVGLLRSSGYPPDFVEFCLRSGRADA